MPHWAVALPALLPAVTRGKTRCCGTAPGMAHLQPGWTRDEWPWGWAGPAWEDHALGISCKKRSCSRHVVFPGVTRSVWSLWKAIHVPGAEICPAVGLGGLEVFAAADTHLPASEAGNRILSGAVLCWAKLIFCWIVGEQQKGGVIFWLLHLRGTPLLEALFSWTMFFKIMGFFSPSLCNG